MTSNKVFKEGKASETLSTLRPTNKKFDTKVMTMMLSGVINQLQSINLYNEDQGVFKDYEQMLYAIETLHTYLYEQKKSNLKKQDARILAAYLVEKTKVLKNVIDKTQQSESNFIL